MGGAGGRNRQERQVGGIGVLHLCCEVIFVTTGLHAIHK